MPTESSVAPRRAPTIQPDDPDPPDDEQIESYRLIETVTKRSFNSLWFRLPPDFARRQGSNIVLVMGVALFLLGCAAFVIGRTTVAELFLPLGLLAVVIATRLGQLVMLKLGVAIAKFGEGHVPDEEPGSHRSPDA